MTRGIILGIFHAIGHRPEPDAHTLGAGRMKGTGRKRKGREGTTGGKKEEESITNLKKERGLGVRYSKVIVHGRAK